MLATVLLVASGCNGILGISDVRARDVDGAVAGGPDAPSLCGDGALGPGEQCDDGVAKNGTPGDHCSSTCTRVHVTTVTWQFMDLATNQVTACPTGIDTAQLHQQALDVNGTPIGTCTTASATCFVDTFACSAGTGVGTGLPAGRYKTFLVMQNAAGTTTYASSIPRVFDLSTADQVYSNTIYNDAGYVQVTWTLVGMTSGQVLSCATAGTPTVSILTTKQGTSNGNEDLFDCTDGLGVTSAVAPGMYTVAVSALDSNNQAVGTANTSTASVLSQNRISNQGNVTIPIAGK